MSQQVEYQYKLTVNGGLVRRNTFTRSGKYMEVTLPCDDLTEDQTHIHELLLLVKHLEEVASEDKHRYPAWEVSVLVGEEGESDRQHTYFTVYADTEREAEGGARRLASER